MRVGERLLEAALDPALGLSRLKHIASIKEWSFVVIDSPQCNAFCLPGGYICVFSGLLRLLPDDDELATVLAHEIAHVVARHSAEKVSTSVAGALVSFALSVVLGGGSWNKTVSLGLELPFSRRIESEADAIGLAIMARACYNPTAAPRVFQKLGALQGAVSLVCMNLSNTQLDLH